MAELTDVDLIADRIADKLSKSWIENDKFVDALVSKVTETVVSQVSEKIVCCNPTEYEEKFGVTPAKQRDLLQKLDRWFCMLEDSKSIIRTTIIRIVIIALMGATIIGAAVNFGDVIDKISK